MAAIVRPSAGALIDVADDPPADVVLQPLANAPDVEGDRGHAVGGRLEADEAERLRPQARHRDDARAAQDRGSLTAR